MPSAKVTVPESPERLAILLGRISEKRRLLLVRGPKNERELKKFLRGIRVPSDQLSEIADGSLMGYINLEVFLPSKVSYYTIELLVSADAQWTVVAKAAIAAGYSVADVRDLQVLPDEKASPVPVSACTALLHNVYANTSKVAR